MIQPFLNSYIVGPLLALITIFLIANDRAFPFKTRLTFYISLGTSLLLSLVSQLNIMENHLTSESFQQVSSICHLAIDPIIVMLLIWIYIPAKFKQRYLLALPIIIGTILRAAFPTQQGFYVIHAVLFVYFLLLLFLLIQKGIMNNPSSIMLAILMLIMFSVAYYCRTVYEDILTFDTFTTIFLCIFYYYLVMNEYKHDSLTKLLLRRNLNHIMEEYVKYPYYIVLIDVDNFKLINDKYGHDRGDDALVTVVNTIKSQLKSRCYMYRYGGDEFVIISRKYNQEALTSMLEKANALLSSGDYHFSYGIVYHQPGDATNKALVDADMVMYENKRQLKSESIWDDMTGLYNFKGFVDELDSFRKALHRDSHTACLFAIDIEHLGNINMAYGYNEGNEIIQGLARVIKSSIRGRDFIAHLGSDEFLVAVELDNEEDDHIQEFITQVTNEMERAYELEAKDYTVTLNISKFILPEDKSYTSEDCINNVLNIKQEEKDNRRKNTEEIVIERNAEEEKAVLSLLDSKKFEYAYQPIVSAKTGDIYGYEALMRSDLESKISPLKILNYAALNNRTYDIEYSTFFNVLKETITDKKIADDKKIFINSIPGKMLTDQDYQILSSQYQKHFNRIVVEITEQKELTDDEIVLFNTRRSEGEFHIAIDDYGSGYSNTNSILRYNAEIIKLDRLLITGIDRNTKKQFFVKSLITFAAENDMKVLAEGVETLNELKTVIRLGVDLIQGYYTAKPSFEVIEEINPDIKKIILKENIRVGGNSARKVYTAADDSELSLVYLAMEDYTRINISSPELKLSGSTEYTADMCLYIKDDVKTKLTLEDVRINSIDDQPCIVLGENTELTLHITGNNNLFAKGIYVPDSSRIIIEGPGNLTISVKGHDCYGIGNDSENAFGNMIFRHTGTLTIDTDGDNCICIGGGHCSEGSLISIEGGLYNLTVAGISGVALGCMNGDISLAIRECAMNFDVRVSEGTAIGSVKGKQYITVNNFNFNIQGSGKCISAIGNGEASGGSVSMEYGTLQIKLNGHKIQLLAVHSGEYNLHMLHVRMNLLGEGDEVIAFGSFSLESELNIQECATDLVINSSVPLAYGTREYHRNDEERITINGAFIEEKIIRRELA